MTRSEWIEIVKEVRARWPHAELPDNTIAIWFSDVDDLEASHVAVAAQTFARDGRPFPPTGGMLRSRVLELRRDDPDHGAAWRLAMDAVKRFGSYDGIAALEWLEGQSPAVALAVERFGYHELCALNLDDIDTHRAQFRGVYKAICERRRRDDDYAGLALPQGGGLRRIGAAVAQIGEGGQG